MGNLQNKGRESKDVIEYLHVDTINKWTNKTFHADASNEEHKEIIDIITTGPDEDISCVKVHQCRPSHCFIELETALWYWSIEKHLNGITVQRSKIHKEVQRFFIEDEREDVTLLQKDTSESTVHGLFFWLYKIRELKNRYNFEASNDQHFAERVFNKVASRKVFSITTPEKVKTLDGRKQGGNWTYRIYFAPDAGKSNCAFDVSDEELHDRMTALIGVDEPITHVRAFTNKLFSWQITSLLLYHCFIEFETEQWWWTIEKNGDGLTIQRSKNRTDVRCHYRKTERLPVTLYEVDEGQMTVQQLIEWLYENNELYKTYHFMSSNCKHFAKSVFNRVAKWKRINLL